MIKKRSRPTARVREPSPDVEEKGERSDTPDEEKNLPLEDLLELRRLRRARKGIDVTKLNKGDTKKRKKKAEGEADANAAESSGLRGSGRKEIEDDENEEDKESKARRTVRQSNFTQQTNALDVDKHMLAYIEENMKLRQGGPATEVQEESKQYDPQEELFKLPEKYKIQNVRKQKEEGNVTDSIAMLTAIPEVDLGMDSRLKNIEETEKAKRSVADRRRDTRREGNEEPRDPATSRWFVANHGKKSDDDIIRDAKLEAMGLRPDDHEPRQYRGKPQTATDDIAFERFKKRMKR